MGDRPVVAFACHQVPEMQLKVFSEDCMLVEPGAYTCALSVLRMAAAHEPADVSEHVVTYWMTVLGVDVLYTQLTGFPKVVCSARAAAVDVVATPQPMDNAETPRMEASWKVMVVVTGGEQPAPGGCVQKMRGARRQVWGVRCVTVIILFMFLLLHGAPHAPC